MGAKMTPIAKKRGRTVFGVRIGLQCQAFLIVEIVPVNLLPGLETLLPERGI